MWSSIVRIMILPLLQLSLMGNNVHSLRKVKLGGKDCTFKVGNDMFTYLLNFRAVVKTGNHGVEEKFIITGGKDLQRGGHQGDWVDNFATLCQWKGDIYDMCNIYDIYEPSPTLLLSFASFAPGEADAEEKSWGGFCPGRAGHWPWEGLSLVRDDFL